MPSTSNHVFLQAAIEEARKGLAEGGLVVNPETSNNKLRYFRNQCFRAGA